MNVICALASESQTSYPAYFNAYDRTQESWTISYSEFGGEAGRIVENGQNSP